MIAVRLSRYSAPWCVAAIVVAVISGPAGRVHAAPPSTGPSDRRVMELAVQLCDAIRAGDISALSDSCNLEVLMDRALRDLPPTNPTVLANRTSAPFAVTKFSEALAEQARHGAFVPLKVRRMADERRALIRITSGQGVQYYDLLVVEGAPDDPHRLRIVDVFVYTQGQWLSESMRSGVQAELGLAGGRGNGPAQTQPGGFDRLTAMQRDLAAGRFEAAWKEFDRLSPEIRRLKAAHVFHVSAASRLGPAVAAKAWEEMRAAFPNDPSVDVIGIDVLYANRRYDEAMAAVERLSRAIDGDAYLTFLRASLLLSKGDLAAAEESFRLATQQEPTLSEPYVGLVTVAVRQKDFAKTAAILKDIDRHQRAQIGDISQLPLYAEFVKSKEYADWARNRPGAATATAPR